ncbi:MAG: DUF420 domain-containing protein [Bacteroidota bacterium]
MNQPNLALAKKLNIAATIVSVVVVALVVAMRRIHLDTGIDFSFLPPFHATLNALAAVALMFSFYFIKNKNIAAHRKANYTALILSVMFLLSYVVYHTTTEATKFGGEGMIRPIYFFLLITHVVLAAVSLPFILFTFIRGYTGQVEKHRKMAKWVFPIWLYVAITGPICYLMLMPYY